MPVHDLFSYRTRMTGGEEAANYVYDSLPDTLRNQIIYIWRDSIGFTEHLKIKYRAWKEIHDTVAKEHGLLRLSQNRSFHVRCTNYLLKTDSVGHVIDLIEASFSWIHTNKTSIGIATANDAIDELNERFHRAHVGYRFEGGRIFRIDSEWTYEEAFKPALRFLNQKGFAGPREEFMEAHSDYRAGKLREAITNANNAFESTLKAICAQRKWKYPTDARASNLLSIVRGHGLFPNYLDRSFDQLIATLQSGLPQVRNNTGAHGQGPSQRKTPDYVAAYALHLAAANIVFVAEAHRASE